MAAQGKLGEFDLIAELLAPLADNPTAQSLKDDAACFTPPKGYDLVISTDALVAGVHFPTDADAGLVARRLVACNISDLAAKGAKPVGCLLTLGVGAHWDGDFLRAFTAAFGAALADVGMQLWGGDTVAAPTPFVSLAVHGLVPQGGMLTRRGAQDGDDVYVTGTIGDGWLDLAMRGPAYAAPQPPLAFGQGLIGLAHAGLDISDGLVADLDHLCRASGGTIVLEAEAIPLSAAGRAHMAGGGALQDLLSGGDDLQIAFTAPPARAEALIDTAHAAATGITRIGRFSAPAAQQQVVLRTESGAEMSLPRRGYSHF